MEWRTFEKRISILWNYGSRDEKTVSTFEFLDGAHELTETTEKVRITYDDGSAYCGEREVFTDRKTKETAIDHPWGVYTVS